MIDKKKTGEYLKKLRLAKKKENGKPYTQNDFIKEYLSRYEDEDLSVNAVAEWENGYSFPSINNLKRLSEIYDRTVDEIIEGEDYCQVDYSKKYFLANERWTSVFDNKDNLYQIRNEQIKLITKNFKKLILTRIDREFTVNEEQEFRFLFDNFYDLSFLANDYSTLESENKYMIFMDAIRTMLLEIRNMNKQEKFWEIQKLYIEKRILWFTFFSDVCGMKNIEILQERFNDIEDWQKDMLLSMFQTILPKDINPMEYGSKYLSYYEKQYGEYNPDENTKLCIKELINRGAVLNKMFMNHKRNYPQKIRIINELEQLYELCLKPIEIRVMEDSNTIKTYKIENNSKNRFLNNYYYPLSSLFYGYTNVDNSIEKINYFYKWFIGNEEIDDITYSQIAKNNNIDINRDKKYWMADLEMTNKIKKTFSEFKQNETNIKAGLERIKVLEKMLVSGEKEYIENKYEIIGGEDEESIRNYVEESKTNIVYSEYLNSRDKKITKELLDNIDSLSIGEIRNKYFAMEEVVYNE